MKKLLLFLFAIIATLGLHAEQVALVAPGFSYTTPQVGVTTLTAHSNSDKQYSEEGYFKALDGTSVVKYKFERTCFDTTNGIRFFKPIAGNTALIIFTPVEGIKITKIEFNVNGTNYLTLNGTKASSWTGESSEAITFVGTTSGSKTTTKVNYIEVTYETAGPKEPVEYTSLPDFIDVPVEGTSTVSLGEKHPEITWSSANESIATVENGVVTGVSKGSTTITATWKAVENEWLAGSAEIKVNVFELPTMSLISDAADLELGKFYTIGYLNYIASANEYSNYFSSVEVTFENNTFKATDDVLLFTLVNKNNEGQYLIKLVNYAGNGEYLSMQDDPKFSKVGEDNAQYATIEFTIQKNVNISFTGATTRTLKCYESSKDFRYYNSNNGLAIQMYKEVEPEVVEPEFYRPRWKDQTLQVGNQYQQYPINLGHEHPEVTFTSSDEAVATVEGNEVKAVGLGTALITGSWGGDDDWYEDARAFRVTVIDPKKEPTLKFQHDIIHGKIVGNKAIGVAAQAAYYDGDGELTYESSNTSAVTVDAKTGMVRPGDIKRAGKVFITANATGTASTNPASASYILYIDEAPVPQYYYYAIFDFTKNKYGMYEFNSDNCTDDNNIEYYEATINQKEDVDHNHVMIVNENNIVLNFLDREGDIDGYRLWKDLADQNYEEEVTYLCLYDAHFSITAPEGCTIDKIAFSDYTDRLNELMPVTPGGLFIASQDEDVATWVANDNEGINSVEFEAKGKETHFGKITVNLRETTQGKRHPNLTFKDRTYTVMARELLEGVQAAEAASNVDIHYTIDNLSKEDGDYILEETNENVLNILIDQPGVYTLRATSDETDEYVAGMAIARVDVFPKYEISVKAGENDVEANEEGVIVLPHTGGTISMTTLDGPYTYSVKVKYDDEENTYDEAGPEFTLEEDDELHMTVTPQYAGTFSHTSHVMHVYTQPVPATHTQNGTKHTFTWSADKGHKFFYRLDIVDENEFVTETPASAPRRAAAANYGQWIEGTDGSLTVDSSVHTIDPGKMLHISTKTVKSTAHGDIESLSNVGILSDGQMSGVADVVADEAEVRFYNLEGVEMKGELAPGLYIQVKGNKAAKVSVK